MSRRDTIVSHIAIFLPVVLCALFVAYILLDARNAQRALVNDIQSGSLTVYRVTEPVTSRPYTIELKDDAGVDYISFDIFPDKNLYAGQSGSEIRILTKEFAHVSSITDNSIAFVRFFRDGKDSSAGDRYEMFLKKEGDTYTRSVTPLGTVFEIEEKDSFAKSGRFLYKVFFKDSDYSMLISVSFRGEDDVNLRYSPLVTRQYAEKLYKLMTSSLKVNPSKLHAVFNL